MGLRINHNLASLNAALNLGRANSLLSKSLGRLSTGLKINQASDGPADLIISEKMRSQIKALAQATENTENAISMLSTAEGALNEVNSLLTKIKGLALKAAQSGTQDPDQIAASQAEIDSALQSINSIARNTAFGSKFLLDGSLDISTAEVNSDNVSVDISRANFVGDTKRLTMDVISAAQKAENSFDLNSSGELDAAQTLRVVGVRGSSTITFAAGAAGEDIAKEINDQTTQTGVTASYDGTNKKIVLNSVEYGATEYVTIEDVDGTNDILRGELAEQKTKASIMYGGQFKITAKEAGTSGNNVAFLFNSTTTCSTAAISITQDTSTGATKVIMSLEDKGAGIYADPACAGYADINKNIDTTLSEIKSLIESNTTLNNLVSFELADGATLTDKVSLDSSFTTDFVALSGGASGEAAAKASLTMSGTSTCEGTTANSNSITFTAKTAGTSGNDITMLFATTDGEMCSLAINNLGSNLATATAGYFSAGQGNEVFYAGNGTIWVNREATFQQIKEAIDSDDDLSQMLDVTFTGSANSNYIVTSETTAAKQLSGGSGITGGKVAETFIDLSSTSDIGLLVKSKQSGADGNGVEFIIRNRGAYRQNTVDVYGNKVIVNIMPCAGGECTGLTCLFGGDGGANIGTLSAIYAGNWANQYNWSYTNDDSLGDNAVVTYNSTSKTINITLDLGETTAGKLQTAIGTSSAVLDSSTGLTVGDAFCFTPTAGVCLACSAGGAFLAGGSSLKACVFNCAQGTLGCDATADTSAYEVIQLIRQNSAATALIDVDYYIKGTGTLDTVCDAIGNGDCICTSATGTHSFDGAAQAFGDFRYVLTGGYNGDVQTNAVTKTGVNGQVKVNGVDSSAQNLSFTFDNGDVRGTVTLDDDYNQSGNTASFTITSKGAFFQMGQKAQLSYQTGIALKNISSQALGSGLYLNPGYDTSIGDSTANQRRVVGTLADLASGAKFDLSSSPSTALDIIEAAIKDVSSLRAQIGAFISNTLESNINSLGVAFENLTAAESRIRDVDFAAETSEFTRAQILVQAGTSVAAQANVATQAALQLLG